MDGSRCFKAERISSLVQTLLGFSKVLAGAGVGLVGAVFLSKSWKRRAITSSFRFISERSGRNRLPVRVAYLPSFHASTPSHSKTSHTLGVFLSVRFLFSFTLPKSFGVSTMTRKPNPDGDTSV